MPSSPLSSPPRRETVSQWRKTLDDPLFVISSAARNLRSLTFVRDDNATFGNCDTVSGGEGRVRGIGGAQWQSEFGIIFLPSKTRPR